MIKKMWGIFKNGKLREGKSNTGEIYSHSTDKKYLDKGEESKPITITDEDPFKNVRKVLNRYEKAKKIDTDYANALVVTAVLKDIKNWDEGVK